MEHSTFNNDLKRQVHKDPYLSIYLFQLQSMSAFSGLSELLLWFQTCQFLDLLFCFPICYCVFRFVHLFCTSQPLYDSNCLRENKKGPHLHALLGNTQLAALLFINAICHTISPPPSFVLPVKFQIPYSRATKYKTGHLLTTENSMASIVNKLIQIIEWKWNKYN